jgi:leucyl aminopeptidase
MAVPTLSITRSAPAMADADVLVLGVVKGADGPNLASDDPAFASIAAALESIGATGAPDQVRRLPAPAGGAPIALVGLGGAPVTPDALRLAAGAAARIVTGIERLAIALPIASAVDAAAVLEGAGIGAYAYTGYRVGSLGTVKTPADEIVVHLPPDTDADVTALVERATALVSAVHSVRDLVNTPPSDLYPETLAAAAVDLAQGLPVEVEILDVAKLEEGGYGGILAVGSGSPRGPRMVTVRYSPKGAAKHLSLVGKGITFDSGGLSLKPAASMVGMKYDMTGAVTVLAVTLAAARLGLPVKITARMCIAENMPSGSSMRPNDVLRIRGGTTVEVLNTDAEGRLVLADGIVDASEEQPDAIVDVATLTGSARNAMGERIIPVMGDEELSALLVAAGADAGETLWRMPLPAELRTHLDSEVADISNGRPGQPVGGMLVAALFLRHFVGQHGDGQDATPIPWAHLDIAGVANTSGSPYGMNGKGPTGASVRTLLALTEVFSEA